MASRIPTSRASIFWRTPVTRDHQEVFELYQNSNFEVKCFRAGFPTAFAQSVVPQLKPRLTRSADFTTRIACGC